MRRTNDDLALGKVLQKDALAKVVIDDGGEARGGRMQRLIDRLQFLIGKAGRIDDPLDTLEQLENGIPAVPRSQGRSRVLQCRGVDQNRIVDLQRFDVRKSLGRPREHRNRKHEAVLGAEVCHLRGMLGRGVEIADLETGE